MADTRELAEAIPLEDRAHFDDLDGIEDQPPAPASRATTVTSAMLLDTLRDWGIPFTPYTPTGGDSNDWLTHNRNAQQGWGPLCGVIVHNTAMNSSQASQLAYLWRGDGPTSSKPGPLCQFAVGKDGMIWLMAWGCATHSGAGDPDSDRAFRANNAPLTRELPVNTTGTSPGTVRINPHYFGIEQMHGSEGPTAAQHRVTVRLVAALLHLLGGPANGYGAGSVGAHRELTTQRSDPQGVTRDGSLRREVAAALAAGPVVVPAPVVPPAVVAKPTTVTVDVFPDVVPLQHEHTLTAKVAPTAAIGSVQFQWHNGDGVWRNFGKLLTVASGVARTVNRPGVALDHHYRAVFTPTTRAFTASTSAPVVAPVVDLLALRRAAQGKA